MIVSIVITCDDAHEYLNLNKKCIIFTNEFYIPPTKLIKIAINKIAIELLIHQAIYLNKQNKNKHQH
jgi:hypothetical protein